MTKIIPIGKKKNEKTEFEKQESICQTAFNEWNDCMELIDTDWDTIVTEDIDGNLGKTTDILLMSVTQLYAKSMTLWHAYVLKREKMELIAQGIKEIENGKDDGKGS